jgi:L-malate glycosyltransferase
LRRIINKHNIKVINPHFPEQASLVFLVLKKLKLFKGKIIFSFHGSDVRDALLTKGLERKLWKIMLRSADHIVVVSNDLAKNVSALDARAAAKITTIYNGVDLALFAPIEHGTSAKPSTSAQGATILSIGAFVPWKGHAILVRAFEHVLKKVPDARLTLVGGDGSEFEPVRELINSMSLANKVTLFKDVPHERVPEFLSKAKLFVLASRKESFGLAVTEAAAAKVPVVCTKAEGVRELITDGVNGRLVEIDDHTALASAIIDVLAEPEEAQRMAINFYDYVKTNLTWRHTYEKYLELPTRNTN